MSPVRSSRRFPVRTLVLMILALLAFIWMWVMTHRARPQRMSPLGPIPAHSATDDSGD